MTRTGWKLETWQLCSSQLVAMLEQVDFTTSATQCKRISKLPDLIPCLSYTKKWQKRVLNTNDILGIYSMNIVSYPVLKLKVQDLSMFQKVTRSSTAQKTTNSIAYWTANQLLNESRSLLSSDIKSCKGWLMTNKKSGNSLQMKIQLFMRI